MFGFIRKRHLIIHAEWYVPLLDFNSDTKAFYQAVEEELNARRVPGLIIERINFRQAGLFSGNREYLRVRRERAVLDLCSGPFGTSWWFSARAATLPRLLYWWELIVVVLALGNFWLLGWDFFDLKLGNIAFIGSIVCFLLLFFAGRVWAGIDEFLIYLPVVGAIYEAWFRKDTYQRIDQRRMFADIVNTVVCSKVKEFCHAGGADEPEFVQVSSPEQILTEKQLAKYLGQKGEQRA
jgi:hypothetical protein